MPGVEIKVFSDFLDALGKAASILGGVVKFPPEARGRYRQVLDDTYQLIDASLVMIIVRLGNALGRSDDNDFLNDVASLDNYREWLEAERAFRLCDSLRAAVRELESIDQKVIGPLVTRDWGALQSLMHFMLDGERDLANFISDNFRGLADEARSKGAGVAALKDATTVFRQALISERQRLIKQETELPL